ncbi:F0F1 ATP synthase subunit A, partial [Candidatus Uhrbacteria bacterium]|nr:F0F1 ATP synthase subunit A [Candidatus Uhrbacteria bacterium]
MNISLAAEPLFHIGTFPVTNTLIMAVLVVALLAVIALRTRRVLAVIPHGIGNAIETVVEQILLFMDSVTHDRAKSERFLPVVATIFLFVIVSNWIELVPGLGTIGFYELHHGEEILVPFIRSASADLNVTLAVALFSVIATQIMGMRELGVA